MKTRFFACIRRSALLVLALLSPIVSSALPAAAQGDGGTYFDGVDDQISVATPTASGYSFSTLSIEAWVRFDGNGLPDGLYNVLSSEGTFRHSPPGELPGGWSLAVTPQGRVAFMGYWAVFQTLNQHNATVNNAQTAPGAISPGQWHHIAVAATAEWQFGDGHSNPCAVGGNIQYGYLTKVDIFVDGVDALGGTQARGTCIEKEYGLVRGSTVEIGGASFEASNFFEGSIRDVRIWDVVRSQAEIAEYMHAPLAQGGDLIGLYPLATAEVPDVADEWVADGVASIQAAGLAPLRADFSYTQDGTLVGKILSTAPAAGADLALGETVYYIEYRHAVPNVVGHTVANGVGELQTHGFGAQRADFAYTPELDLVGTIHSTTPAAGAALAPGGIVYYLEYRPSIVPDFVGQTPADAVAYLQAAGYAVERADFAYTPDLDLVGTIHSTTPAVGEGLAPGGTVWYIEYRSQ